MRYIIYGPPGTGKTHTLLGHIENFLESTPPDQIGYFTFSKNAAGEGKQRAVDKFKLSYDDLPYFQTLHSFCFNQLGINKNQVMQPKHYRELSEKMEIELDFNQKQDEDYDGVFYSTDPYIQIINLARSKELDPIKFYHLANNSKISLNKLKIIVEELERYKEQNGLIDFPDMLEKFLNSGEAPRLRVMFVDEAQDLSLIQWRLVKKIEEKSQDSYISGDDDQAIYKWNGAHVNTFINLEGERTVLDQSQRVPQKPFALANRLIKRITNRVEKEWLPKEDEGSVQRCNTLHDVNFKQGKWLVLAQANYMLPEIGNILDEKNLYWQRRNSTPAIKNLYTIIQKWNELRKGIPLPYNDCKKIFNKMSKNWDKKLFKSMIKDGFYDIDTLKEKYGLQTEAEWYEALDELGDQHITKIKKLIDYGEDLTKNPRIKISTIHGVKGNERENVVVTTDLAGAAFDEYQKNSDDMNRLFYVACTRTERNLYIIEPQTRKAYSL
jgi:superfamily I DNA/RNA helicase